MSLKASTSSREFESNNIDIDEAFSTEQTFSESQERNSGRDGGEKSSQKKVRPKKKRKLSNKILTDNQPIDYMGCSTIVDGLNKLRKVYSIPNDIDLKIFW